MNQNYVLNQLSELNFTAIDIETANEKRASICSIGYAKVRKGEIVETNHILVRPQELRFSTINTDIHKITDKIVASQPEFCDLWPHLKSIIQDEILVAHNADFDINALTQTLNLYDLPQPSFKYLCTHKLAQEAFDDLVDYRLKDVAKYFGVEFEHHNSEADAIVSAMIAITAIPRLPKSIFHFNHQELTALISKRVSLNAQSSFDLIYQDKKIERTLLKPDLDAADKNSVFYNQKLVFTGDLKSINRGDAAKIVKSMGADINTAISTKTNIVVVGSNAGPSKMAKIESLISSGKEIRIIYEEEFLTLIS
ncbi:3'-5' exoribonuclease [Pontibacter sp. Tf4]|uniref:exonuclease domain-containing protein n=1 Tax=Pontibacter sp. Tf4 TaxID=2761620 RepID=UPI0016231DF3|nr:exonuclease domain-containing protein [Pontibacter sp. Tf4]MBB6613127.1 3'-5' exoribonuclease [Pontibacter sp. Tf4]